MDVRRLILFVVLSFSILFFWSSWQERHAPQVAQQVEVNQPQPASVASANEKTFQLSSDKRVTVETDVFKAEIDTMGGDIRRIELLKHHADYSNKEDLVLLDDRKSPLVYVAQSGLIGKDLPTHKTVFTAETTSYQLKDNQNEVVVTLNAENAEGVKVTKTYTFTRGSYAVKVGFKIDNASNAAIDPW
ncbi:MAG: membrane protein insertase YidC, partial [Methylophilaceae bacterium]|nr:membrane protein insertase YidC [Methylophilaceae bacterium]